ncbi:aromatic ring-hydroxylating oxygenase subunit alpha [Nocardia colli]|uniref:aromatic ring-hydroxylating oxygenase subunit alpha n=1 Tax=Nocardia colli TaxID=2545717 RepID=UPI0035E18EEA
MFRSSGISGLPRLSNPFATVSPAPFEPGESPILPYPNGWFAMGPTEDLRPGAVLRRRFMGKDIVLYRTRSGLLRATRPYCPHLGAHFGVGGKVDGENLVCPFHAFAFGPTGECVKTGTGDPPPKIRLSTLPTREVNGLMLVWHHSDGISPSWEVEPVDLTGFPKPSLYTFTLHDHPQDVMENSIDTAHLPVVHGANYVLSRPPDFSDTTAVVNVKTSVNKFTYGPLSRIAMEGEVYISGLGWFAGQAVLPELNTRISSWVLPTPIDPTHVILRLGLSVQLRADKSRPASPVGPAFNLLLSRMATRIAMPYLVFDVKNDFPIWQNKTYKSRPRLVKGDGPIMAYRRWAKQFYNIAQYNAALATEHEQSDTEFLREPSDRPETIGKARAGDIT